MSRLIRWTIPARMDLREAHGWLVERNRKAAQRFARRVRESANRLLTLPHVGVVCRDLAPIGKSHHVVIDYYRLIYMIERDEGGENEVVVILRLWDGRQDPESLRLPDDANAGK